MSDALSVLFAAQGHLGTSVLGLGTAADLVSRGLAAHPEVHARRVAAGDRNRLSQAVLREVPWLGPRDLDLLRLRFHASESVRGRALIARELRREPADVVHVTSHTLGLLLRGVQHRTAVALSVDATIWDWSTMGHGRPVERWTRALMAPDLQLERRALTGADVVLTYSAWTTRGVLERAPRARVATIHPGLDLATFTPPTGAREPGPTRLLFVGGRLEEKGGLDLLAATAALRREGTVELDIVSPEAVGPEPGVRAHQLAAGDPRLVALYRQADALCLPTWGDAVPWVVLEALACGTPVIATAVGAIPEQVDHGRAGVLVPARDLRALRAAVEALVAEPERHVALGRHGRTFVEEHYEMGRQTTRLVDALRTAARRPRG